MKKSSIARAITTATLTAALAVAAPLAASAHVHVDPGQAEAGSYSTLTFTVPTESATASTVSLRLDLPTDTPFGSVSYEPVPGWTTAVVTSTLTTPVVTDDGTVTEAPTSVTWTAAGDAAIAPGQFQTFAISVGPVPDTGSITLPVHQTYSDGTVVDWADATPASGAEPEHPAPVLYVNDAPPAEATDATGSSSSGASGASADSGASTGGTVAVQGSGGVLTTSADSSETLAVGLGIGGLALGAIALVVSVFAITKSARRRSDSDA